VMADEKLDGLSLEDRVDLLFDVSELKTAREDADDRVPEVGQIGRNVKNRAEVSGSRTVRGHSQVVVVNRDNQGTVELPSQHFHVFREEPRRQLREVSTNDAHPTVRILED